MNTNITDKNRYNNITIIWGVGEIDGYMGNYGYGLGYAHMLLGIIFWILIIAGAYLLIKWLVEQGKTRGEGQMSALEIAKTRYAKGELSAEEFEEMKKRLS